MPSYDRTFAARGSAAPRRIAPAGARSGIQAGKRMKSATPKQRNARAPAKAATASPLPRNRGPIPQAAKRKMRNVIAASAAVAPGRRPGPEGGKFEIRAKPRRSEGAPEPAERRREGKTKQGGNAAQQARFKPDKALIAGDFFVFRDARQRGSGDTATRHHKKTAQAARRGERSTRNERRRAAVPYRARAAECGRR